MSYYNTKFTYLGKTNADFDLVVVAFDGARDNGATDSYLKMSSVKDKNYNGTMYYEYGARYESTATPTITMVKKNYQDFTIQEFRNVARWLSGTQFSSWLDVQDNDYPNDIICSFLCKCVDLQQYKFDGRVVGVIARFESLSPWAFSSIQGLQVVDEESTTISGTEESPFQFTINNRTDDLYTYVYPHVMIVNKGGGDGEFSLTNTSIPGGMNVSECIQLASNETITLHGNSIITTDAPSKTMSKRFNWIWPKLVPGQNVFEFVGTGEIIIAYRYPIKIGDGMLGQDTITKTYAIENCSPLADNIIRSTFNNDHI